MNYNNELMSFNTKILEIIEKAYNNQLHVNELYNAKRLLENQLNADLTNIFKSKFTIDDLNSKPDIYLHINTHLKQYREILKFIAEVNE